MKGLRFFTTARQHSNVASEVLLPTKLVVWEGLLSFINHFVQPWRNLFWFCFNVYVCLWTEIGSLTMKILTLPLRIYDAIQKEEKMEIEMRRTQLLHLESEKRSRELECELELVSDECKRYRDLLEDAEHEKRGILKKFEALQLRVVELEEENDILKAQEEMMLKGIRDRSMVALRQKRKGGIRSGMESRIDQVELEDHNGKECMHAQLPHAPAKCTAAKSMPPQLAHKHDQVLLASGNACTAKDRVAYESWEVAMTSSLFSIFLTLLVGTIVWQAQDPCIPLVVAVFMVVCMSLKTVAQFLLSIYKGPGFDAVALLSFNWFLLGTLTYPMWPRIAQVVAPVGARFGHWLLRLVGVSYVAERVKSAFL